MEEPATDGRPNPNFIENDLDRVPDKSFRDYALDDRLVDALEAKGITHPFPIQELTLPVALKGQDIIGQARTGTGKTLGFGLPMIQRLDPDAPHTQALIITPTRELAIQVYEELRICEAMGYTSVTVYGGVGYDEQIDALDAGVDIVVGTPGRLLDMIGRGHLDLSKAGCVILDEADEMLDMGFLPDVERILNAANEDGRHTMLFSATMPASVVKLARRYTDGPLFMGADSTDNETAPTVDQHFFQVFRMDKPRLLARILQQPGRGNALVFTRTKAMADRLVRELDDLGVRAIPIHGDIRQASREKNLGKFRSAEVDVLCATEVAARGIDVQNVTHVVNYDLPDDEKMYLHRIGRTARAGARGAAITFSEHNEIARLHMIKKAVDQEDNETLEVFSTSDELVELFDLPDETPWDHLARSGRSGGRSGGGRSSSGSRGSGRNARGSLDSPRGEKHDADLDSDHDRDRDRSRRRGRSLDTRIQERSKERDDGDSGGGDSGGGADRRRSRSRARDGGSSADDGGSSASDGSSSASGDGNRSRSRSSRARSGSDDRGGSSSRSSSGGRVRARGGKPVDGGDAADGSRGRSRGKQGRSGRGDGGSSGGSNQHRGDDDRDRGGRGGRSSRGRKGGGNSSGSNRNQSSNRSQSSNRNQSSGSNRSGGDDAGSVALPRKVRTTRAGTSARGEGNPRLERRVEVEDLP